MATSATTNTERSRESMLHGRRLLPAWIDKVGRESPEKIWALMPRSTDLKDGFHEYKYRHLVAAIDTVAWWIESVIGRSHDFETVAYMGVSDVRYYVVPMALIKTGYKTLFMSHRNSDAGHKDLMENTNCKTLIYSDGADCRSLILSDNMRSFRVTELNQLLSMTSVRHFPYEKTFEEAMHDPIMIVHTSGTTGMPKPIIWTHAIYATIDAQMVPSDLEGRKNVYTTMKNCERHYSSMPVAHSSGLVRFLRAIFMGVALVVGPPERPIGPDPASLNCIEEILQHASVDAAYFLPSTLEALCKSPQYMKALSKLKLVGFGADDYRSLETQPVLTADITYTAPLSREVGDAITKACPNTTIHNSLGSSDGGAFVTYEPDREDWQYICYCPHYNGISWRHSTEGLHEMVIVRDPNLSMYQGAFTTHPELQEWSTRDLYSKHPTKPDHRRHEARVDDLIVSANGAKFNPLNMQSQIQQHPEVQSALLTGDRRLQPALIIQLQDSRASDDSKQRIREEIWAMVSKMNTEAPIQGRVMESFIMFTSPGKDFPTAGKGTIQRAAAIQLYQQELDELYNSAGPQSGL